MFIHNIQTLQTSMMQMVSNSSNAAGHYELSCLKNSEGHINLKLLHPGQYFKYKTQCHLRFNLNMSCSRCYSFQYHSDRKYYVGQFIYTTWLSENKNTLTLGTAT